MDISALFAALPGDVAQGIIWGIMALGVFFTFRILDFADLTVDGSFATGGAVAAMLITNGYAVPIALIAATCCGALAGVVTGLLHTKLGIPGILASILTQISLYSINLNIMQGMANVAINGNKYSLIVSLRYIPQAILVSSIFALAIVAAAYWYFGTEQGSAIRATGSNPNMSKAQGININAMTVLTLGISNGIVALTGALVAQYQGFADINMGRGAIVIGLAAVIIGEVLGHAIFGKRMNFAVKMICVVLGGVVYYIVIGIVLWLRMPTNDLKLFTAIIVAIFLAVPYLKGKANNSFRKAARRGGTK